MRILIILMGLLLVGCNLPPHGGTCPASDPACKDYNDRAKEYRK